MAERQGAIERATRRQLRAAGVSTQANGAAALAVTLARTLDGGVGARDAAAVARELRAAITDATKGAEGKPARSTLDELRAKREARRASG